MSKAWPLILVAVVLAGCSTSRKNPADLRGRDGWVREELVEGTLIRASKGSIQSFLLTPSDRTEREYKVVVKPTGLEGIPVFPGSRMDEGVSYGYKEDRYYSIPDDKTFADVFAWHVEWFSFGKPIEPGQP